MPLRHQSKRLSNRKSSVCLKKTLKRSPKKEAMQRKGYNVVIYEKKTQRYQTGSVEEKLLHFF